MYFAKGGLAQAAESVRRKGRWGDKVLIHVNPDEYRQMQEAWGPSQINPHTGLPEYGFLSKAWKKVKKGLKKVVKNPLFGLVAPIALNFVAPGLGAAIGAKLGLAGKAAAMAGKSVIGAGLGAASGGKRGALTGLLGGAMSGGAGGTLGKALGASGKTASTLGNALLSGAQSEVGGGDFTSGVLKSGLMSALNPGSESFAEKAAPPELPPGTTPPISPSPAWTRGIPELELPPLEVKAPPIIPAETFMDRIKSIPGQVGNFVKEHPFQSGALALAAMSLGKGSGQKAAKPPPAPEGWNDPLPQYNMRRRFTNPGLDTYYTYGEMPSQSFYSDNTLADEAKPGAAQGGAGSRYISQGTGADGRADNIEARLSDGEYVIDTETVALLGNGSTDAGAKKLDKMREAIRAHKGKALSKGKISPNAKSPLQYMGVR